MDRFAASEGESSRSGTPAYRFTSQAETAEDLLKSQTVGLVHLDDFRKRRAEALELRERGDSGASTPKEGVSTSKAASLKKRKVAGKGKISFGDEDEELTDTSNEPATGTNTPAPDSGSEIQPPHAAIKKRKKLGANANIALKPRILTKSALQREAQEADAARRDFIAMRAAVKATEVVIPFVFYDGANTPGGRCRIKKGDHMWLFLDKARKLGAELGVGGTSSAREWARISVDDLMLVRGEVIVPPHYELYFFICRKSSSQDETLFNYSAHPTSATPNLEDATDESSFDPLARPDKNKPASALSDQELEGYDDDAALTKVVDRRWYERNKHIFPASVWQEFNPEKVHQNAMRKDVQGNAFFFS